MGKNRDWNEVRDEKGRLQGEDAETDMKKGMGKEACRERKWRQYEGKDGRERLERDEIETGIKKRKGRD